MKEFKKTPITKERLFSFGFQIRNIDSYQKYIDGILVVWYDVNCVELHQDIDVIELQRDFKTMEDIKELITGLAGKRL